MPATFPRLSAAVFFATRRARLAETAFVGGCATYIIGLLASRALLSLSPIFLLAAAIAQPGAGGRLRATLPRNGPALALLAYYPLLAASGLWSEDQAEWRHLLIRFLPFVALPLAFSLARPLSARARRGLGLLFIGGTTVVAGVTAATFLAHYEAEYLRISQSQNMDTVTGVFHLPFGVMMALAAFFALRLAHRLPAPFQRWGGGLLYGAAGLLALLLHLLAYRTGLLVLYVLAGAAVLRLLLRHRRYVLGVALLLLLLAAPPLAYQTLPSIRQRVGNTRYDLNRFLTGQDINEYSLSQRLAAWSTALALIPQHWAVGVAPADIPLEMARQYARRSFGLRPENYVLLHNQYLFALLSLGLPGLGWLLVTLFGPLRWRPFRADPDVVAFLLAMATTMLVDTPLSLGSGLHLFAFFYAFLLIGPRQQALLTTATGCSGAAQPAPAQLGIADAASPLCHLTLRPVPGIG